MVPNLVDFNILDTDIKNIIFQKNTFYFNLIIGLIFAIVFISFFFTIRKKNNNTGILEKLYNIREKAEYYSNTLGNYTQQEIFNRNSIQDNIGNVELPNVYDNYIYY